jgi:hypothetical protein
MTTKKLREDRTDRPVEAPKPTVKDDARVRSFHQAQNIQPVHRHRD